MGSPSRARLLACMLVSLLALAGCTGDGPVTGVAGDSADSPADAATAGGPDGCVDDYEAGRDYFPHKVAFDEATGVTVTYADHYKVVEVLPPSPDAEPVRYVLVQCGTPEPDLDAELVVELVVEIPVGEVVTLTTTNLPHFDELAAVDRIVGVGTAGFIATEAVLERVEAGDAGEFADDFGTPDLERLLDAAPDLMIVDGFGDTILDDVRRYTDAGIPTVIQADFNEHTLLGRAEWVKYTALFLNAEAAATATFDEIRDRYEEVLQAAAAGNGRPTVFANSPWEGSWFMPGGESFFANAVEAAGGAYVFADDPSTGALMVDIETVLERAGDADVWLQAGSVHGTLDDLLTADERFGEFKAFQDGQVWAYDRWTTPGGGNAFFEVAYTRADLFLADLVTILHPGALTDHELVFFGQVPRG